MGPEPIGDRVATQTALRRRRQTPDDMPSWNAETGVLTFRGLVVKRFTQEARLQRLILAAFEELGWPSRIDDPLPGDARRQRERLHNAIKRLNLCQVNHLIRFRRDGTGEGIIW